MDDCINNLSEREKRKIPRKFTAIRILRFICDLFLGGIYGYLILGGVSPLINKFGERAFLGLSIPIIVFSMSKLILTRIINFKKNQLGCLVYFDFEKKLIEQDALFYTFSKWMLKIPLIVGFSFGTIACKLNLVYPII